MSRRDRPAHYHAYMLRMWEERSEGYRQEENGQTDYTLWRFQVEEPQTGRRQGFADLPALLAYLRQVIDCDDVPSGDAARD